MLTWQPTTPAPIHTPIPIRFLPLKSVQGLNVELFFALLFLGILLLPAEYTVMDDHSKILMGRKTKLLVGAALIVLLLTCYFCWEILLQERVILDILRIAPSKGSERQIAPGSDHLEEVVESWFEKKEHRTVHVNDGNSTNWESTESLMSLKKYRRKHATGRTTRSWN